MRWLSTIGLAALLLLAPIWAQAGPTAYGVLGVENPAGEVNDGSTDLVARGGVGLEWGGLFGEEDLWIVAQFVRTGWGDPDLDDEGRWNYFGRLYFPSYWDGMAPWVGLGIEHQGNDFMLGQENLSWVGLGVEPSFAGGWVQVSLQGVGVGMEQPTEWRFVLDLVPQHQLE